MALGTLSCTGVWAQTDSAQVLPEFTVSAERTDRRVVEMDNDRGNDLSDQLLSSTSLDVRSNGKGVLSTVSFRGGRTTQTTAQWMGLSIESPTNATVDLSLVPSFLFDEAELSASSSNVVGPGAISGAILMSNRVPERKRTVLHARLGSFQHSFLGVDHEGSIGGKWHSRTRIFGEHALNNFPYADFDGEKERMQQHLRNASGVMQEFQGTQGRWSVTSRTWLQHYYRQIPPTMLEARSGKEQTDRNIRSALRAAWKGDGCVLDINLAYGHEFLNYTDPFAELNEDYYTQQYVALLRYHHTINKALVATAQLDDRYATANASEYYNDTRNEISPGLRLRWSHKKWRVNTGGRKSFYLTNHSPFLLNTDIMYHHKAHEYLLSYSNNYRLPSMNDLFWKPGGNPALNPEQSHRTEFEWKYSGKHLELSSTLFFHRIFNQIRWIPGSNGIFSAVQSEETVWNRGVEVSASYNDSISKLSIKPAIHGQWLMSTNSDQSGNPFVFNADDQQLYIPLYRIASDVFVQHNNGFSVRFELCSVGQRVVLQDRSKQIDSYLILNGYLNYSLNKDIVMGYQIRNASNQLYFNQLYRPMPGTNHLFSIVYQMQNRTK